MSVQVICFHILGLRKRKTVYSASMHVMCLQIGNLNKNSLVNITVLYLMCNKTKLSTVQEVNFFHDTKWGGGGGERAC